MTQTKRYNRRQFIGTSVATGALVGLAGSVLPSSRVLGANDRINIGAIGVGGRGRGDLDAVSSENIVALCDVDSTRLSQAAEAHPAAQKYVDYRKLLEQPDIEAVVIATPDHHHAPATFRALRRGLHVYCEKPLTHTIDEARQLAALSAELNLATQMGTQNHQHPSYLRTVELIKSGAVGPVREVHVRTDRPGTFWPQGVSLPSDTPPVPDTLAWDIWLGPAAERPYHPAYVPFKWRGFWDFGCGAIGDMAIHLMDPAYWALDLYGPVRVSTEGSDPSPVSGPTWMIVKYEFGPRGDLPACDVFWYEGTATPRADVADILPENGSVFIGDEGTLVVNHGEMPRLLPEEKFADFEGPAPFLPTSPGHHLQWIEACKTGSPTGSSFDYAAPFTEIVLLGNVAYRTGAAIEWDPATGQVKNMPKANEYLSKEYRPGWEI
ncbi:MAG: Gfo/Idh/MocA family oxidoreductase [Pirellulales bacterium]